MPIGFSGGWRVRKSVFGGSFCGDTLFNRQSYFIDFFFSKRVQGPKNQPGSSAQDQRKRDGTEDDAAFDALRLLRCSSNKSCYRQHISRDCPRNALGGFGDKRGQGCDGGFGSFAGMLESFLVCPGELTDDQVMELLKISFRQPEVVLALAKMVHDVHERSNVQNPLE